MTFDWAQIAYIGSFADALVGSGECHRWLGHRDVDHSADNVSVVQFSPLLNADVSLFRLR